jgi:hypothetical protein
MALLNSGTMCAKVWNNLNLGGHQESDDELHHEVSQLLL